MVNRVLILLVLSIFADGSSRLDRSCLNCHKKQKVPSELIYRRYLMQYSSREVIEKRIYKYLKEPKQENSIMPNQFFLKFPMKKMVNLDDFTLRSGIRDYIEFFDIKKRLILPKE